VKIKVVKVVFEDGTKAIVGENHETELEAERFAGCIRDSWTGVKSAEVIHRIPPVKIKLSSGRLILK
jgi:hypothetical protein